MIKVIPYLIIMLITPIILLADNSMYEEFNDFALQNFGPEVEPLIYEKFGSELTEISSGAWRHVSRNSACIAWETNLPAKGYVEYGSTPAYGNQTEEDERYFYMHIHYLRGLTAGTTYHYRHISVDERGNILYGESRTFTAELLPDAIEIPGSLGDAPYYLNQAGATYILTQDIDSDVSAINIMSRDITLDLNGYTVRYNMTDALDTGVGADPGTFGHWGVQGTHGIRTSYGGSGAKVLNGSVIQGAGGGGGDQNASYHPLYFPRAPEVAGVTVVYHGTMVTGIRGGWNIHHNVILDLGSGIINRHTGVDGVHGGGNIYNNLFKRVRHRGINPSNGAIIRGNEINVDSWDTNAYGIMCYGTDGAQILENRIMGTGYLAIGIGTLSSGVQNIDIHSNLVQMQGVAPLDRSGEYGSQSSAYGVRITWGGENLDYYDNLLIARGRDGGQVRGVWFCPAVNQSDIIFRDNVIKTTIENEASNSPESAAIAVTGTDEPDVYAGIFQNNTIYSNFIHVVFGNSYGAGRNARFIHNRFIRLGSESYYRLVVCGYWIRGNNGNRFIDPILEDGASFDHVRWIGTGANDFSVGWTLNLYTNPGAAVVITDNDSMVVFSGMADAEGLSRPVLTQYLMTPDAIFEKNPYTITAQIDGRLLTGQVSITGYGQSYYLIVTNVEDISEIPTDYALSQNYPNPFNPTTTISYSLASGGNVSLVIYDILGRKVAILVNEIKPAGNHAVQWDGTNKAGAQVGSGVYFYQLKSDGGYIKTNRMLKLQ